MVKKIFFTLSCFGFANALTLQEAIDLTLNSSHTLKEQEYLLKEKGYNYKAEQNPFYPKLNIIYTTIENKRENSRGKTRGVTFQGSISYNLFNGMRDYFDLLSAKSLLEAQEYKLQSTKEDLILEVKQAYINILRQKQNLIVAEESKALLEQQRKESKDFFEVGFIPKNDLLKVEVELTNSIQNLLTAKSNLAYAIKALERYTRTPIKIQDLLEIPLNMPKLIEENLKNLMYQKRSELLYANKVLESKDFLVKSAKGAFLPRIIATGDYYRYSDDFDLSARENVAYSDAGNVTLEARFNLFNGFLDKNNLESKRVNKLAYQSQRISLIEKMDLQLFSELENYNLALNAYKVAKHSLKQAEENYRISQNRYKERIQSTSDFLDAEYLLTRARSKVVLTRYAIIESLARIERITQTSYQDNIAN